MKGLHDLSQQNKAWLRAKLLPVAQDTKYLEDCRRKVANFVYKETKGMPSMPRFREAKKVISEYRKSTSDLRGTLDLMLTYLERGHEFTLDFGDIDEAFYDKLINMLEHFAIELRRSPAKYELYEQFRPRLIAIRKNSNIGWDMATLFKKLLMNWKNCWEQIDKQHSEDQCVEVARSRSRYGLFQSALK